MSDPVVSSRTYFVEPSRCIGPNRNPGWWENRLISSVPVLHKWEETPLKFTSPIWAGASHGYNLPFLSMFCREACLVSQVIDSPQHTEVTIIERKDSLWWELKRNNFSKIKGKSQKKVKGINRPGLHLLLHLIWCHESCRHFKTHLFYSPIKSARFWLLQQKQLGGEGRASFCIYAKEKRRSRVDHTPRPQLLQRACCSESKVLRTI